jgi:hypothetical protein
MHAVWPYPNSWMHGYGVPIDLESQAGQTRPVADGGFPAVQRGHAGRHRVRRMKPPAITRMTHVKALRAKDLQSGVHAHRCGVRHFGGLDTVKKFPIHPGNPGRICWGCDKYCQASELACSAERTLHPAELFGEDWQEWAPGHVPMTGIDHESATSAIDAPCDPANEPSALHPA